MASKPKLKVPDGCTLIFRPWRKTKDGKILWAKHYGLRAWPILIRDGKEVTE